MSWLTPTAQIHVAAWPNGCPGHSWQNVSSAGSSIGHKAAVHAGKVLAAAAAELLERPEILKAAREEFGETDSGRVCVPDSARRGAGGSGLKREKEADSMQRTILIAEDDKDIVNLLSLYLKNSGYEVLTAPDGLAAWGIFNREHVDLALLDVMMPRMDGWELARKIRGVSNIPIIFLSAKDQDYDRIMGLQLGADDYLTKPF